MTIKPVRLVRCFCELNDAQRSIAFLRGVDRPSGEYHFYIIELLHVCTELNVH